MTNPPYTPTPGSQSDRSFWTLLKSLLRELYLGLGKLLERGKDRQLILKSADDRTLLRVPATLAVILGLVLLWKAAPFLIIAVVVALVLKVQFIVASDVMKAQPASPAGKQDSR